MSRFKVGRAERVPGDPGYEVAIIDAGVLFYPRSDGETFDWPAGVRGDGEHGWRPSGMPDGELVRLRWQLVCALTAVEDAMGERDMFRRYTDAPAKR